MNFRDKVIVVTGAASGIGLDIADRFLELGAKVVYSDISEFGKNLDESRAVYVKCDVSDSQAVTELVQKTVDAFGKLDIMVNNAGIGTTGDILNTDDNTWRKTIDINLGGVFYGTREAARVMVEKNIHGSIINMSSILGEVGFEGAASYCASKGGLVLLTKASAIDLAKYHIRVNAVAPGFIKTTMTKGMLENPEFLTMVEKGTPMGYVGEPRDVTAATVYLASDESRYVTGTVLFVDGGWRAK